MRKGPVPRPLSKRFWAKVIKAGPDDCWLWKGSTDGGGYGKIRGSAESHYKTSRAHRIAYELVHGTVPNSLHVLHSCDNRACANPAHLFLGTNAENVDDRVNKGRSADVKGEKNVKAKLTEIQVLYIRSLSGTQNSIAMRFGVSTSTIWGIRNRKSWKHI